MSATNAIGTSAEPLPVLVHDGSRLDWVAARYSATVALQRQASAVIHELHDAPEIETLLSNGDAAYATEIRCPRTMLSRVEHAEGTSQVVKLHETERNDNLYLIPGIVAVRDTSISASGLHPLVRGERAAVDIPAGWWLARGGEYQFEPLLVSLLRFVKDGDDRLKPGTMSVEEAELSGNPYFKVTLAAELYDHRREHRDIQIAALIAAFGQLPRSTMARAKDEDGDDGVNADCPLAQALRARLEDAALSDWDSEFYDPARAATSMESFWIDTGDDE
ncbi:MAG: hypothetical protein OXB99_16585 [Acidimicrobiaceae bacterium]|nr:hypothetical protein [Acidimicrobiaceae bacterium]